MKVALSAWLVVCSFHIWKEDVASSVIMGVASILLVAQVMWEADNKLPPDTEDDEEESP